jgi:hypothetical protein
LCFNSFSIGDIPFWNPNYTLTLGSSMKKSTWQAHNYHNFAVRKDELF